MRAFGLVLLMFVTSISGICDAKVSRPEDRRHHRLMTDALLFYNTALRDEASGQYYDAVSLDESVGPDYNSSVAATGLGLVSLALGDATGTVSRARDKAIQTLEFVLGGQSVNGQPYLAVRSAKGWFRHWFDARLGENNDFSRADGFSVIDTAILAAGAQTAAHYFDSIGADQDGRLRELADRVLLSVEWESAIADLTAGKLTLTFALDNDTPRGQTSVFNEYIVAAAIGAFAERKQNRNGLMTEFWNRHYSSTTNLPKKSYEGIELLTDWPGHYLSDFTIQMAYFLSADVANSSAYMGYADAARRADQLWFSTRTARPYMWGLGAGELLFRDPTGQVQSTYQANRIDDNPFLIVSPQTIAGFIPIYPQGLSDLLAMHQDGQCSFSYKGYELLWRCSLTEPDLAINRVQAVDYAMMVLGLASLDVGGMDFFKRHAPSLSVRSNLKFLPNVRMTRTL